MKIMDIVSPLLSLWNQETYQRLQLTLNLSLRHQILLGICDDLKLRNHLVELLPLDLPQQPIITININPENPYFFQQIDLFLQNHQHLPNPTLQILGIELLTRQPASKQGLFLRHLQTIVSRLSHVNYNLLIWLNQPWFYTLQESASNFWRLHTGIFEFEGEPTAIININNQPEEEQQPRENPTKNQAEAYLRLANYYHDRVQNGENNRENIMLAIQAYQQALPLLEIPSISQAEIINDLGNLYWLLSTHFGQDQKISAIDQAIFYYQQAVTRVSPQNGADTYTMIQNNLGIAYTELAIYQDKVINFKRAIKAYHEGLHYRQDDPLKYATTQNNLGITYWQLAQLEQPINNLKMAISAYNKAISHYLPDTAPLHWAMIQNNLGNTYLQLAQFQHPDVYLGLAIAAYQQALKYRTADLTPAGYATTQNNLAMTYWLLANMCNSDDVKQQLCLQDCILSYQVAINQAEILKHQNTAVSFDLIAAYNNLGIAQTYLATKNFNLDEETKSSYLQLAIENHLQALKNSVFSSEQYQLSFAYLLATIRGCYQQLGMAGQNLALNLIPVELLTMVMQNI
jgi:tetratricopeptide (TPR) repeat protein